MNPWISRAEHSLRNDRPRLAALYMRRGLTESFQGRAWLAWFDNHAARAAHAARFKLNDSFTHGSRQ